MGPRFPGLEIDGPLRGLDSFLRAAEFLVSKAKLRVGFSKVRSQLDRFLKGSRRLWIPAFLREGEPLIKSGLRLLTQLLQITLRSPIQKTCDQGCSYQQQDEPSPPRLWFWVRPGGGMETTVETTREPI